MNQQAQRLVTKFNTSSRHRMARANAKDEPTEPLFHYTTEKALYSILQSKTFWFTSIYHMDDKVELSFGFGMAHDLLSAALAREDVLAQTFLKPLVEDFKIE